MPFARYGTLAIALAIVLGSVLPAEETVPEHCRIIRATDSPRGSELLDGHGAPWLQNASSGIQLVGGATLRSSDLRYARGTDLPVNWYVQAFSSMNPMESFRYPTWTLACSFRAEVNRSWAGWTSARKAFTITA